MAQKFLSIKNFETYQHYKHRNPPWIRLYGALFHDKDFIKLPIASRYLYLGLLTLCARHANRVPNDCAWIAHELCMNESEIDLKPLYHKKFLLASRNHVASMLSQDAPSDSDSSDSSDISEDSDTSEVGASTPLANGTVKFTKPELPIPDDWEPKDYHVRFALARGLDIKIEAAHFRGRAIELGWVTKDWDRKFSNWMLQEVKFRQQRSPR